jgi:antirestriction protein
MSIETQQRQQREELQTAWNAFQSWTGTQDERRFREAYLGHYADRGAFGEELLARLGADGRLEKLPDWLRAYIRFDGEAVVRDFESAGHFYVFEAPEGGGAFVFDRHSYAAGE